MSEALWTSADAALATGGRSIGDWSVTGLSIDSRSLRPGDLFIPLKDSRDGHDFIPMARKAQAGAVLSERQDETSPALIVENCEAAMRELAIAARRRAPAMRVAVTGSVGKTSLKEAIASICQLSGKTHKSLKSFNNHWGVPLTLAAMPKDTEYGVFEVGMNHAGELSDLSPLVTAHVSVITKIAPAHLAHFDSVDAIAAAKAEIFDGALRGGFAVLNADDDYFEFLSQKAKAADLKVISFGHAEGADVRIANSKSGPGGVAADLIVEGDRYPLSMGHSGSHWVQNGACAFAVAMILSINPDAALDALAALKPLAGRGETLKARIAGKTVTLIDESYNANPESMRAAIAALGTYSGRKIAVLGDMYELGKDELTLHADLSEILIASGVERVIMAGECMRALRGALPRSMRGAWAKDWETALEALQNDVLANDVVLVKGSNATGLGKLVSKIKEKEPAHVV
jgi:UDP-N-acetylmuramoyl-tripeptide--D-alanyl-D-alanine ligase